jgi:DNA-binding transcriptional LysR family regulator
MTLHQFTIFAAIAKHGNLTKASQELHISQPAVSKQMRLLQEQYGAKLFLRRGRGVALTLAGERFRTAVSPILKQVRILHQGSADSAVKLEPDRLAVGGSYSPSAILLPRLLSRFRKSHPDTEIEFRTSDALMLERLLLKQSIELAVTTHVTKSSQLVVQPFRREKLALLVSCRHPLAYLKEVSVHHLARTPFIVRSSGGRDGNTVKKLKAFAEEKGVTINVGMRFESPSASKAAILKNMGIGMLYEDVVKYNIQRGELKVIKVKDLKLENQSYIVYLQGRTLSAPAAEFLRLLISSQAAVPKNHDASGSEMDDSNGYSRRLQGAAEPSRRTAVR